MVKRKPKKDDTNASKIAITASNAHPIQTMFKLLIMGGTLESPSDLVAPYDTGDVHLSIAIPKIKFGIAFESDKTKALEDDGWSIQRIAYHDVEAFARVFFAIDAARISDTYAKADPNVKNTSHAEEKLFTEIIRRGMPIPNRNLKFTRDDGTELTTPDFAWEEYNVAFFMDGSYWHSIKDDQAIIKEIKKSRKMRDEIVDKRKDKVRKDAAIRSELGALGWIVLACTDDDLETAEGVHEVVDLIERTLRKAEASRQFRESVHMDTETKNMMSGLLASSADDEYEDDGTIVEQSEDAADDSGNDDNDSDNDFEVTTTDEDTLTPSYSPLESSVSDENSDGVLIPTPRDSDASESTLGAFSGASVDTSEGTVSDDPENDDDDYDDEDESTQSFIAGLLSPRER